MNKKKRMNKKVRRIIEISCLVLFIGYLVLFLIDYNRFKNSEKPLITLITKEKEYDDGYVKSYYSLGWLYREYRRETISDNELVPFWSKIKMDDILIRDNEDDLPEMEEHSVPNNASKSEKIDDILFFFDEEELLGTYKCINSEEDCEIATHVKMEYDEEDYKTYKMSIIDKRYVFVNDYKSKNTPVEEAITYLFDIKANRVIAKYEGVRYTTLKDEKGLIDNSKYIVKKNGKWGIDQVILGKVTNKIPFIYDYIKYDENTKLYILRGPEEWQTLNIEDNKYSASFSKQITNTYKDNDTYLVGINTYDKTTQKTTYELYDVDGNNIINKDSIDYLTVYNNFIAYTNNLELHLISYAGTDLIAPLRIYFKNYNEKYGSIMSYYLEEKDGQVKITIPLKNSKERMQNEYFYNKETWEMVQKRLNVFENDK